MRITALLKQHVAALRALAVLTLLTGVAYPLLVLAVAQLPGLRENASGSIVVIGGKPVGSSLIGQSVTSDRYFYPRPSAAGGGYDPLSTGASNLGPESADLLDQVRARRAEIGQREGGVGAVPPDAVTASGSGLDPDISPDYAALQVARVAQVRGVRVDQVRAVVAAHTSGRTLGFLGEARVNVLELNLALDRQFPVAVPR